MPNVEVLTGLDVLLKRTPNILKNRRVGLITNPTGMARNFKHVADVFHKHPSVKLVALYGPEHGLRGNYGEAEFVASYRDEDTGCQVHSLYGPAEKPTHDMISNVDILVFDIQDIGTRFFTYIYTMSYAMEAAAEVGIPFVVLDRPNPINGVSMEGNIHDPKFKSFVGLHPIPIRHGMTVGELALLFNEEFGINADLNVVKMKNWRRNMWYDETGLIWVQPSPNMPTLDTVTVYPGTCLFEGTNVSEGRGTTKPFELIGAPWIHGVKLSTELNSKKLPGVLFRTAYFSPTFSKYTGKVCCGIQVHVVDKAVFKPVETGLHIIDAIAKLYPNDLKWIKLGQDQCCYFDLLAGTNQIRRMLEEGMPVREVVRGWQSELSKFVEKREKYLLY
jgi:uncharacterized protein YbbC (DUF1343 family)